MNIDAICEEARQRLSALTEQRCTEFRQQADVDAERTRRSFGQRLRWHAKRIMEAIQS